MRNTEYIEPSKIADICSTAAPTNPERSLIRDWPADDLRDTWRWSNNITYVCAESSESGHRQAEE